MTYTSAVLADSPLHFWTLQEFSQVAVVQSKSARSSADGTSLSVTMDATPTNNNTVLLIAMNNNGATFTTPAGFTSRTSDAQTGGRTQMFTKVASGESATYTITQSASAPWVLVAVEISGTSSSGFDGDVSSGNIGRYDANIGLNGKSGGLAFVATGGLGSLTHTIASPWSALVNDVQTTGGTLFTGYVATRPADPQDSIYGFTNSDLTSDWGLASDDAQATPTFATIIFYPSPTGSTDQGTGVATNAVPAASDGSVTTWRTRFPGPFGTDYGVSVDGVNAFQGIGYLNVAHNADMNITGYLTLECWALLAPGSTGVWLIAKGGAGLVANVPYIFSCGPSSLSHRSSAGGIQTVRSASGLPAIGYGSWHHMAVTKSGTTLKFYLDGVEYAADGAAIGTPGTNTNALRIGNHNNNSSDCSGVVAYPAIWNSTLTATQIANHYAEFVAHGARLAQQAIDLAGQNHSAARLAQVAVELAGQTPATARLAQLVTEVAVTRAASNALLAQLAVEVAVLRSSVATARVQGYVIG